MPYADKFIPFGELGSKVELHIKSPERAKSVSTGRRPARNNAQLYVSNATGFKPIAMIKPRLFFKRGSQPAGISFFLLPKTPYLGIMKSKPFLKALTVIAFISAVLLMVKCKTTEKAQKGEIAQFLTAFNKQVEARNTDSVLSYFAESHSGRSFLGMANLLSGKSEFSSSAKPVATISLDMDNADIKMMNDNVAIVSVVTKFSHDSLTSRESLLKFTIKKTTLRQYKIQDVDAKRFLAEYADYESVVRQKTMSPKDMFSPETIAAFKTARALKPAYDSVVWLAHVDKKTYYYVVKGKWDMDNDINRYPDSVIAPYKMGLVNPDLKEVIPPQYDLIHNISGTFAGLVEVEKDGKKGFYNLDGKIVLPVNYDQVFPVNDGDNLAILRNGADYFYLKHDTTVSDKVDLKISDIMPKIKGLAGSFDLYKSALNVITEYNSETEHGAIYIAPSYLVDLNIINKRMDFKNPLRKIYYEETHLNYKVAYATTAKPAENWLEATFYNIRDYFLGGRSEFYDSKNIVIVDKKNNRLFTQNISAGYSREMDSGEALKGLCDVNNIKIINDTLYEVKAGARFESELYDSTKLVTGGPYYHYFVVKNNKLAELPNDRNFGFTKYAKMDDSYLNACYTMLIGSGRYDRRQQKTVNQITPEMLRMIKNEIFADYAYKFKDKRWEDIFMDMQSYNRKTRDKQPYNISVDDSLTVIDKYNINWINQRLKGGGAAAPKNTLAAK